jgi:hypothetical protein
MGLLQPQSGMGSGSTTIDYVHALLNADLSITANAVIPFASPTGNIPVTAGVFTLQAGKTYLLTAVVGYTNTLVAGTLSYQWRNITTNTLIGSSGASLGITGLANLGGVATASAIVTPTTPTTVRVENIGITQSASGVIAGGRSHATIIQLGTSSASLGAPANSPIVGTNAAGNFVQGAVSVTGARGLIAELDGIQCRIAATGNASLQLTTTSGSKTIVGTATVWNAGVASSSAATKLFSITPVYWLATTSLTGAGDIGIYIFRDQATFIAYKCTILIGTSIAVNTVHLERL